MNDFLLLGAAAKQVHPVASLGILDLATYAIEQHSDRRPHDLEMAELFGRDVHQHVVFVWHGLADAEGLHEILHRRLEFTVRAAELIKQQAGESGVRARDAGVELQFLGMHEHQRGSSPQNGYEGRNAGSRSVVSLASLFSRQFVTIGPPSASGFSPRRGRIRRECSPC